MCRNLSGDGFIVSGNSCKFIFYEKNEKDPKHPYTKVDKPVHNKLLEHIGVNCFVQLNEDLVVAGLTNGSLMLV